MFLKNDIQVKAFLRRNKIEFTELKNRRTPTITISDKDYLSQIDRLQSYIIPDYQYIVHKRADRGIGVYLKKPKP